MTTSYQIRPAANADGAAIRTLVFAAMEEFGLGADPDGADADLQDIEASFFHPGGWFELVLSGDTLVGTVGMLPVGAGAVELRKMYLLPEARGAGLGKALLARQIRRAGAAGFSEIVLETATVLAAAIALYRRFGFERVTGRYPGCGKQSCDQVWRLRLDGFVMPDVAPLPRLNGPGA